MKIIAYTIIALTGSIFIVLGFFIVKFAVIHENNITLISSLFENTINPQKTLAMLSLTDLPLETPPTEKNIILSRDFCLPNFNAKSMRIKVSIVDFLNINDFDSSFANRAELAEFFDLPRYSGTASENLMLLKLLKSQAELCRAFL